MNEQYQNPGQPNPIPPLASAPPPYDSPYGVPSWDYIDHIGFQHALFQTIKEVLFNPIDTFRRMAPMGNLGKAFLYALMLCTLGVLVSLFFQTAFQSVFGTITQIFTKVPIGATALSFGMGILHSIFLFLISIISICISIPLRAGLIHLALMLFVKIRQPFESTFRIVCYATGSTAVWSMIPCVGGIVTYPWYLVCTIIGVREQNHISTGTAIMVVLLPLVAWLMCCCICATGAILLVLRINPDLFNQFSKQMPF